MEGKRATAGRGTKGRAVDSSEPAGIIDAADAGVVEILVRPEADDAVQANALSQGGLSDAALDALVKVMNEWPDRVRALARLIRRHQGAAGLLLRLALDAEQTAHGRRRSIHLLCGSFFSRVLGQSLVLAEDLWLPVEVKEDGAGMVSGQMVRLRPCTAGGRWTFETTLPHNGPVVSPEQQPNRIKSVPDAVGEAPTTLPGRDAFVAAFVRLETFTVNSGSPLAQQLEEVMQLGDRVDQESKHAQANAMNKIVASSSQAEPGDRATLVIALVKQCADRGINKDAINLTRAQVLSALQIHLDSLNGQSLGSFEKNKEAVETIRAALHLYNLRLIYKSQTVSIRPAPQRNATIECRLPVADRKAVYAGTAWPRLTAALAD